MAGKTQGPMTKGSKGFLSGNREEKGGQEVDSHEGSRSFHRTKATVNPRRLSCSPTGRKTSGTIYVFYDWYSSEMGLPFISRLCEVADKPGSDLF